MELGSGPSDTSRFPDTKFLTRPTLNGTSTPDGVSTSSTVVLSEDFPGVNSNLLVRRPGTRIVVRCDREDRTYYNIMLAGKGWTGVGVGSTGNSLM